MSKILITGVSAGVGRALTKKLVEEGSSVWGIARRKELLLSLKRELNNSVKFNFSVMDIAQSGCWEKLTLQMKKNKFIPDTIIFNAAISENDLSSNIETDITRKIFAVNFFGILEGIKVLLKLVKPKTQFIAICSSSSSKGSGIEGIGYPASKSALSIAFECLHLKFKNKYLFKTIYFGPINSGMGPFKKDSLFVLKEDQAVNKIIQVANGDKAVYYYPEIIFFVIKLVKLLPANLYFSFLTIIDSFHLKNQKKLN